MRVNSLLGSRPTSSANMQKTSRLTKCATACGSWPRSRSDCASVANLCAARSVISCRVSPGRSRSGVGQRPLELVAGGRVPQVFQDELVGLADAVGPVGADAEAVQVADDQQRWVLQRQRVLPQLPEGGVQVGVRAFVLPAEVAALPHVGPAVAARVLLRAALEAIALAGGVGFDRRRLVEHAAQVVEVRLRRLAFLQLGRRPLGDELVRRHVVIVSTVIDIWAVAGPTCHSRKRIRSHNWSGIPLPSLE